MTIQPPGLIQLQQDRLLSYACFPSISEFPPHILAIGQRPVHVFSYLESRHLQAQYALAERTFSVARYVNAVSWSRHQPLEGRSC
jgi:hypothetical protein